MADDVKALQSVEELEAFLVSYSVYREEPKNPAEGALLFSVKDRVILALSFDDAVEDIKSWSELDLDPTREMTASAKEGMVREIILSKVESLGCLNSISDRAYKAIKQTSWEAVDA